MTASLVARGVSAAHGARVLFGDLDLVVAAGDVIGLVGANGAGKSTLLRQLAGLEIPDGGTVSLTPSTASIGYLAQEPERRPRETVRAYLHSRTGVSAAQAAMDVAAAGLADPRPGADDEYAGSLDRWLALGGADLDDRIHSALAEVGLDQGPDAPTTTLSGGQAARMALAALLLSRYDVYLLDEPTNDLDLDGLVRLERFVQGLRTGVVLVSHDREFLARTVTSVLELDLAQQQVRLYGGGYDAYLAEREVARSQARAEFEAYAERRGELGDRARRQRDWMSKGVRNARRKSTDSDKLTRNFRADASEKQAAKARQTERLIERLEVVEEPRREWELRLEIAAAPRSGSVVAVLDSAVVRRGDFVLGPVSLQVDRTDRIAVTGPNGSGKTTLLGALLGQLPLDAGRSQLGSGVVVGEVDQARRQFTVDAAVVDVLGRLLPEFATAELRTLLAKFGLRADHLNRSASTLSPGERTRAGLALLQARGVNLLVLDEPTNHLDLPAIEQLEAALATYAGTLLLVSHDRRLLESVRTNRAWAVEHGRLQELGSARGTHLRQPT